MKMIHPDVEAIADVVSDQVFHAVWAPRGWKLLGDAEAFASEVLGKPVKQVNDLKVDELKALVSARGLEYPPTTSKKDEVIKTFRGTFAEEPVADEAPEGEGEGDGDDAPDADPKSTNSSAPADTNQKGK